MRRHRFVPLTAALLIASFALLQRSALGSEPIVVRMMSALHATAEPLTERAIVATDSAGMTFAVALRGKALGVEFPFPGPAAHHRYVLTVDRRTGRASAARIDAHGTIVAGPIRGRANTLFPLTVRDVVQFIENTAGSNSAPRDDFGAYRVIDTGPERLGAYAVEHLHLIARRDPATYALTDVYVDRATMLPRRITADVALPSSPRLRVGFVFDFARSATRWIVSASRVRARVRIAAGVTRSGFVDVRVERAAFDAPVTAVTRRSAIDTR